MKELFFKRLDKISPTIKGVQKRFFSFRINRLRSSKEEVVNTLKEANVPFEKVDWFEDAFIAPLGYRSEVVKLGSKVYIQNLSSIFCALQLELRPNEWLLDLASAPGGKSLLWSSLLQNEGKISAVEKDKTRFFMLKRNIKAQGAKNIRTFLKDGRAIGKICFEYFDKVLLDAPCSSESKFDLHQPEPITYWSMRRIYRNAKLQKELILSAYDALKVGGEMIYATCTYAPEENEAVVDFLLRKRNAKLLPIVVPFTNYRPGLLEWEGDRFDPQLEQSIRILPDEVFNGFFLAKIKKG